LLGVFPAFNCLKNTGNYVNGNNNFKLIYFENDFLVGKYFSGYFKRFEKISQEGEGILLLNSNYSKRKEFESK